MGRELATHEIEACARAAHEVNRAYCILLNDHTQAAWDTAPDWQKESARAGVVGVAMHDLTPEQSHESWRALKIATGWKYGTIKNPDIKEHPCMVPYAELPAEQKVKDELYTSTVKSMLACLWRIPQ